MTDRLHARSRRAKAKRAPRMFTAATGLITAANVDQGAESTPIAPGEAKQAAAAPRAASAPEGAVVPNTQDRPVAATSKEDQEPNPANLVEQTGGSNLRLPKLKLPNFGTNLFGRHRVDRPPRVFSLHDPDSSPKIASPPSVDAGQAVTPERGPEPATATRAPELPERAPQPVVSSSEAADLKVPEPTAPDILPPAAHLPAASAKTRPTETPKTPTRAPKPPTKPAKAPTKASRGPRAGRPWRGRRSAPTGSANRRQVGPTRHPSAKASPPESRRLALPLVGRMSSVKKPKNKKRQTRKSTTTPLDRRRRIPVAVAGLFALAVLATSFPFAGLLSQHHQLSAAAAQLAQVQRDNRALSEQQRALNSNEAVTQLARGDYQMVSPGQTLYDVLPPDSKTGTTTPGAPTSGDPGNQPLVAPANAPDLSPQPGLPQPIPASADGSSTGTATPKGAVSNSVGVASTPSSFWGRVTDTLEFWK